MSTITEGPWCFTIGTSYDIIYVDDWGDGGFHFTVFIDGLPLYSFEGSGEGNVFTFDAVPAPLYDLSVMSSDMPVYGNPGDYAVSGEQMNLGSAEINSLSLVYTIDGGLPQTDLLSGLSINPFTSFDFNHSIVWNAVDNGTYNLAVWAEDINGSEDLNHSNDTLYFQLVIGDPIPNILDDYLVFIPEVEVIGDFTDDIDKPTDLDFHPVLSDFQVWVTNKGTEGSGGSTVTFWDAGKAEQTSEWKKDGNAWHFMSLPTAIAFSPNTNFATSPGVKDANHSGGTFTGPTLWSSDMDIYAEPSGGNGSHLDMLHQSPYSMGIASYHDNAFFVFCDWHNYIHMYDFKEDHGPGNSDHDDGVVWEYTDFDVEMIDEDLPSHLAYDTETDWLYIVDAGNARIIRLKAGSGEVVGTFPHPNEVLAEASKIGNCDFDVIVTDNLVEPVGIDVLDNRMIVGEHATGDIILYDISEAPAIEMGRIATGAESLMGIKIGPDGFIWFVDQDKDELARLKTTAVVSNSNLLSEEAIRIFPSPANDIMHIEQTGTVTVVTVRIIDPFGRILFEDMMDSRLLQVNTSALSSGNYVVRINSATGSSTKQIQIVH